jgi:hypothetical protein
MWIILTFEDAGVSGGHGCFDTQQLAEQYMLDHGFDPANCEIIELSSVM